MLPGTASTVIGKARSPVKVPEKEKAGQDQVPLMEFPSAKAIPVNTNEPQKACEPVTEKLPVRSSMVPVSETDPMQSPVHSRFVAVWVISKPQIPKKSGLIVQNPVMSTASAKGVGVGPGVGVTVGTPVGGGVGVTDGVGVAGGGVGVT